MPPCMRDRSTGAMESGGAGGWAGDDALAEDVSADDDGNKDEDEDEEEEEEEEEGMMIAWVTRGEGAGE